MTFAIPTLSDLVERARRAFRTHLPGSDAWLFPNNIGPTAKVLGGLAHEVMGYADYIRRQIFVSTADIDNLVLHGDDYGLPRLPPSPSRGKARFVATGALTVLEGAVLRRSDGVTYTTTEAGALVSAGTLDVAVISQADGRTTRALAGTPLTAVSGVTGDVEIEVSPDGLSGGDDIEDVESYRERLQFRRRNPPHGGSAADYVRWAREVRGVTRVYVERLWQGPGTVRVFVVMDDDYPGQVVPESALDRVRDYLQSVKPADALVTVASSAVVPIAVTIAGLSPDTTNVRAAIVASLQEAILTRSRTAGGDVPNSGMPYLATPTSFSRSWIVQAVANAAGEDRHNVTLPAADQALTAGQIATLGTVSFIP